MCCLSGDNSLKHRRIQTCGKLCMVSPCRLLKMCSSFSFGESRFSMDCLVTWVLRFYTFPHCCMYLNHYFVLQLCLQNRVRSLLCSSAKAHCPRTTGLGQAEFPPSWAVSEENIEQTVSTHGRWKAWNADGQNLLVCSNLNIIWDDNYQSKIKMGMSEVILDW